MSTTTMRCPRCGVYLFLAPTNKAQLAGCGRCGGVFLGKASAQQVFERLDAEVHSMASMASGARSRERGSVPRETPAGPCPVCAVVMRPRRVEMASVLVDDCDAHGTWFDHDELQAWMDAVARMRGHKIGAAPLVAAGVAVGAVGVAGAAAYAASGAGSQQIEESGGFADGVIEGMGDAADAVDAGGFVAEMLGSILGSLFD